MGSRSQRHVNVALGLDPIGYNELSSLSEPFMYTIYGIKNCSTMKKAFAYLDVQGIPYTFVDYKKQSPTLADLERWRTGFGELPVNKAGTTYRNLKADYEAADAAQQAALLVANPSAIKRPILEGPKVLLKGFNPGEWAL
jgi:arsenate reductase